MQCVNKHALLFVEFLLLKYSLNLLIGSICYFIESFLVLWIEPNLTIWLSEANPFEIKLKFVDYTLYIVAFGSQFLEIA